MTLLRGSKGLRRRAGQTGFSLIEVLIALVVLGVGLLGLALLQTMNLRYTQSAHQRTVAVNLASELLDTMRANRSLIAAYAMDEASFADVVPTAGTGCAMESQMTAANNIARWKCEVRESLGPAAWAAVVVGADPINPVVTVTVHWDEANMPALTDAGKVELSTTL